MSEHIKFQDVALGDCCEIISGSTPSRLINEYWNGDINWFTPKDLSGIKSKYVTTSPEKITQSGIDSCSAKLLPPKSLLLSSRAPIGHIAISTIEACTNQGFKSLIPNEGVNVEYLFYAIKKIVPQLQDLGNGATFKEISKATLSRVTIPLPSLPEQQKIASILDAADNLRQKDQQLIEKYTALSQSLFLEMFGDPIRNLNKWEVRELATVCTTQLGKMLSGASKKNINPKKYLRNANVRWGSFDLKDMLEMDFDDKDIKKFTLSYGDLLVCEGGDIGRCAIWKNDLDDCFYQKALHRVRVNNGVLIVEYLQSYFYWMSKLGALSSSASEVTFSHLTAEKLKKLKIPIPPIELQNQYAERIKSIETQKQLALASLEKSEALFNTLLQRAFKGELT